MKNDEMPVRLERLVIEEQQWRVRRALEDFEAKPLTVRRLVGITVTLGRPEKSPHEKKKQVEACRSV